MLLAFTWDLKVVPWFLHGTSQVVQSSLGHGTWYRISKVNLVWRSFTKMNIQVSLHYSQKITKGLLAKQCMLSKGYTKWECFTWQYLSPTWPEVKNNPSVEMDAELVLARPLFSVFCSEFILLYLLEQTH